MHIEDANKTVEDPITETHPAPVGTPVFIDEEGTIPGGPAIPVTTEATGAEAPYQESPEEEKERKRTRTIVRVSGIALIVWGIAALVLAVAMYMTNSLPSFAFDSERSMYTQENLQMNLDDIVKNEKLLESDDLTKEERQKAENNLSIAKQDSRLVKMHVMWRFMVAAGGIPCIALFIVWFIYANKERKRWGVTRMGEIIAKTAAFIVFGGIFFNVLPGLVVDIASNILQIIGLVVGCYIAWRIIQSMSGFTAAGGGSGELPEGAPVSQAGTPEARSDKRDKGEKKETLLESHKHGVFEVPSNLPLKRVETTTWGKAIAYAGADGMDHYVCSQKDYDRDKVAIVDERGDVRPRI